MDQVHRSQVTGRVPAKRKVTTAPDLEVPLSGERLMAVSNR